MDELFRFNIVRPPNGVTVVGVPLDYGLPQSRYPKKSFLGAMKAASDAAGSGGRPGLTRKDAARMAADAVTDVFRTQQALLAEPLLPTLIEFRQRALEVCATLAAANPGVDHAGVQLAAKELAPLSGTSAYQILSAAATPTLLPALLVKLVDSFLVQFVRPVPLGPSLGTLADAIRAVRLALGLQGAVSELAVPKTLLDLESAANGTMVLPAPLQLPPDRVQPVGVADLLVVRQQLVRYESADIQAIENVLKSEKRGHTLKRSLTSETETTTEEERLTEELKSLDSTDRSELKSEVQSSLQQTLDARANLELGYGEAKAGTWHFKLTAGVQYTRVAQESAKFSSTIAKEVTQKASSKLTERTKQTRRTKTTEVLEDMEDKRFENVSGEHIRGVYQYLNKIYLAQVFNYGKRLLFDLQVPEPASYLLQVYRDAAQRGDPVAPDPLKWVEYPTTSGKPSRPLLATDDPTSLRSEGCTVHTLSPEHLRPELELAVEPGLPYTVWVAHYAVGGVQPSPDLYKSAPYSKARDVQADSNSIMFEDTVQLPDGYRAVTASVTVGWRHLSQDTDSAKESAVVSIRMSDGRPLVFYDKDAQVPVNSNDPNLPVLLKANHITSEGDIKQDNFSTPVITTAFKDAPNTVVGSLPIAVSASKVDHVTVTANIACLRTDSWLRKWQLETFGRIVEQHSRLVGEYNRAVESAALASGAVGSFGRNTATNRKTEQLELKRAAINILSDTSGQELLGKDTTKDIIAAADGDGKALTVAPAVREPRQPQAGDQGRLVRFFEQAFEWDKIGYVFYPYFWSRMDRWSDRLKLTDIDPMFEEFLRAGSARVVLPVRPGFESAVMYYLLWDEPWMAGDLPAIGDPLYLPISEEIREKTGAPQGEVPQGDAWEITVPTDLVYLRKDDSLPKWDWVGHAAQTQSLAQGDWAFTESK